MMLLAKKTSRATTARPLEPSCWLPPPTRTLPSPQADLDDDDDDDDVTMAQQQGRSVAAQPESGSFVLEKQPVRRRDSALGRLRSRVKARWTHDVPPYDEEYGASLADEWRRARPSLLEVREVLNEAALLRGIHGKATRRTAAICRWTTPCAPFSNLKNVQERPASARADQLPHEESAGRRRRCRHARSISQWWSGPSRAKAATWITWAQEGRTPLNIVSSWAFVGLPSSTRRRHRRQGPTAPSPPSTARSSTTTRAASYYWVALQWWLLRYVVDGEDIFIL